MRYLLALAVLLLSSLAHAVPIEVYYQTGDGDDWAPAFERAQLACRAPNVVGCSIELGARAYKLGRTVNVCTPVAIVGTGAGVDGTASLLSAVRTTIFRTWSKLETCPLGWSANGTLRLEHVSLQNLGISFDGAAPFYGVEAKARLFLNDVRIYGFTQGIRLVCTMADKSNCNESHIVNVDSIYSEHAGVYVQGADANAILFDRVRADANCRYADRWNAANVAILCSKYPTHQACTTQHYQCAGFIDYSFLGNTYTGCAAANENTAATPVTRYAGYVFAGGNQATTGIGLYAENDTIPNWADAQANIVGGLSATWSGPTFQLHGMVTTGLSVVNNIDPANPVRLDMGSATNIGGTAMAVLANAVSPYWPWRWKVDVKSQQLFLDVGNTRWLMSYPHMSGNIRVPDTISAGQNVCSPKTGCVATPAP